MLTGVLLFECRQHARSISFALASVFFALLGFVAAATGFGPDDVHLNGPYGVANALGLLSLGTIFSLTLFSAPAVLRDDEHQMAEIVYATAVTKADLLLGRFLAALLAGVVSFAAAPVGLLLGTYLVPHEAGRVGPFQPAAYLWPFAVLALPTLLFVGAVLFTVAALTRRSLATYVAGVALYVLYMAGAMAGNSPLLAGTSPTADSLAAAALVDPFGISAFFEQTQYATPAERNTAPVALEGLLLKNRLLVVGVSLAALALAFRLFRLRIRPARDVFRRPAEDEVSESAPAGAYEPAPQRSDAFAWLATLRSRTALELRQTLLGWPFLSLLVLLAGSLGIELWQSFRTREFGTALYPTTALVVDRLGGMLLPFGLLVVVFFCAELGFRDRALRVDELVDATPAGSGLLFASKLLTLGALIGSLALVATLEGIAFQALLGPVRPEVGLYLSILYFTGLPLLLLAVLALFLQTIAPNRYAGVLVTVLVVLFWHRGSLGGPEHPLLRFAPAPEVALSDLNGFAPLAGSFGWFMLHSSLLAGLLLHLAVGLWRRGTDARLLPRLRALPARWRAAAPRARAFGLALAAAFLATTGFVFFQTNVENRYETAERTLDWRADYERAYRHLEKEPHPSLVSQALDVELFPREGRCRTRGTFQLENRGSRAIATVWVAARRDLRHVRLTLAGREPDTRDARFGMYAFELAAPLPPGGRAELTFDVSLERRGAVADGDALDEVVGNGSFLLGTRVLPTLGYRLSYELRDPDDRRRRGLEEKTRPETPEEGSDEELARGGLEKVPLAITISTDPDQIAVAPGPLRATWEENGRRFFRYATERPVSPVFACASGRFAIARRRAAGVDIEVLYHPAHGGNVERILEAAARTLDYGSRHFGPYPFPQLRIVEIPSYWKRFAGLAMPGVVFLVEDRGFLTDTRDATRVDVVSKRIAHEVAHQWWGHELSPPSLPGATVLVESLARYSELMILKELHGREALAPVLAVELKGYLSGRAGGDEVPLYRATEQSYLYYSKGALVLAALEGLIGEESVNRALAEVFRKGSAPGADVAGVTSLDLVESLRAVTPEAHRPRLDEWFKDIVLYDQRVLSATSRALPDGRFHVTARLSATRSALRDGRDEPLEMDEEIPVAIFAAHPGAGPRRTLYQGMLGPGGPGELSVVVGERPEYVSIDPDVLRIDRDRADNLRKVEDAGASPLAARGRAATP